MEYIDPIAPITTNTNYTFTTTGANTTINTIPVTPFWYDRMDTGSERVEHWFDWPAITDWREVFNTPDVDDLYDGFLTTRPYRDEVRITWGEDTYPAIEEDIRTTWNRLRYPPHDALLRDVAPIPPVVLEPDHNEDEGIEDFIPFTDEELEELLS